MLSRTIILFPSAIHMAFFFIYSMNLEKLIKIFKFEVVTLNQDGTQNHRKIQSYDTHGNVWEWCADDWHENYSGAPNDGSAWITNNNNQKLLRGGSWLNPPRNCRSAYRNWYELESPIRAYIANSVFKLLLYLCFGNLQSINFKCRYLYPS